MASLLVMRNPFYTSTEASQITGCSRRQLQYWRREGVVVPTVNPGGKGRNVYYSESDLIDLAIMEYLLSMNLNFDFCVSILFRLRSQPVFLFSILLLINTSIGYGEETSPPLSVNQELYKLGLIMQKQYHTRDISFEHWAKKGLRLMLLPQGNLYDYHDFTRVVNFNSRLGKEFLEKGYPVIPFWLDRIYEKLQDNLEKFHERQEEMNHRK